MNKKQIVTVLNMFAKRVESLYCQPWEFINNKNNKTVIDSMRQELKAGPDSMPITITVNVINALSNNKGAQDAHALSALWLWNRSLKVFDFDKYLSSELSTNVNLSDIPVDRFYRLPVPCPFIVFPIPELDIFGFFAYVDRSFETDEMRFTVLSSDGSWHSPYWFNMKYDNALKGFYNQVEEDKKTDWFAELSRNANPAQDENVKYDPSLLPVFANFAMYLTADNIDSQPRQATVKKAQGKPVYISNQSPEINNVGYRIGEAYNRYVERSKYENNAEQVNSDRKMPPHIRKAHWHTFFKGPKGENRQIVVHWLSAISVNFNLNENVVPTIHDVKRPIS